jgi:hypothetical protein
MPRAALISALARSFLAGDPAADAVHARAARTLGRSWRWLRPLVRRYAEAFAGHTRPRHRDAIQFLREDSGFRHAWARYRDEISIAEWIPDAPRMQPVRAAEQWNLPVLENVADLADWLCLTVGEVDWYADLRSLNDKQRNPKFEHYRYRILHKCSGGVRLLEIPRSNLKELQRRILSGILDRVPAHPSVHGFVKGRSIATFAAPHTGKHVLLRLDLEDFFPAFPAARAEAIFRTLGYPEPVASRLAGICTHAVHRFIWKDRPLGVEADAWANAKAVYSRSHLPQGAPASPALANVAAYRVDCRLSGLAKSAGAVYTRYADDLAFSGEEQFGRAVYRFADHAAAIALEEGFHVNHRKTRVMRQGARQQLAGIVVNRKLNLKRKDIEIIEAILTNCRRHGTESQNREGLPNFRAHLEGRVGFVEMVNRDKGQKLRAILESIEWQD